MQTLYQMVVCFLYGHVYNSQPVYGGPYDWTIPYCDRCGKAHPAATVFHKIDSDLDAISFRFNNID